MSPILAGFLLEMNIALSSVGMIMSIGSLVGAGVLLFLSLKSGDLQEGMEPVAVEVKANFA